MNKELQDKAWTCLSNKTKKKIKSEYKRARMEQESPHDYNPMIECLEDVYGVHNLTSDTEPETKDNMEIMEEYHPKTNPITGQPIPKELIEHFKE